jgi:hypothetical protein
MAWDDVAVVVALFDDDDNAVEPPNADMQRSKSHYSNNAADRDHRPFASCGQDSHRGLGSIISSKKQQP